MAAMMMGNEREERETKGGSLDMTREGKYVNGKKLDKREKAERTKNEM